MTACVASSIVEDNWNGLIGGACAFRKRPADADNSRIAAGWRADSGCNAAAIASKIYRANVANIWKIRPESIRNIRVKERALRLAWPNRNDPAGVGLVGRKGRLQTVNCDGVGNFGHARRLPEAMPLSMRKLGFLLRRLRFKPDRSLVADVAFAVLRN